MTAADAAPPGSLRSVITWLEMTAPPEVRATGCEQAPRLGLRIERADGIDVAAYRALYRAVGERWLWWERLVLPDDLLAAELAAPGIEIRLLRDGHGGSGGATLGYSELDRRDRDDVEIVYFGLVPAAIGGGLGRYLMAATLAAAWTNNRGRVWLHTCSEDHPDALGFYTHMGFTPWRRETRLIADPRAAGLLPAGSGPHIPPAS